MKAFEWHFFVVLLIIMLYKFKVVLTFESMDEILKCDHSNESYLVVLVVLFVTLYKVSLTFDSVHAILKCDHSNENYCKNKFYIKIKFLTLGNEKKIRLQCLERFGPCEYSYKFTVNIVQKQTIKKRENQVEIQHLPIETTVGLTWREFEQ